MSERTEQLLKRLDEIGESLERSGKALALLGLGSVGIETDRLDDYSDLDFFAIVKPGTKKFFMEDLGWLANVAPITYAFGNTVDGYKLLYADGIFCEFAVFEPHELSNIPFAEGRIVWKAPGVDDAIRKPIRAANSSQQNTTEWLLGEALTCLYVGLNRYHRGEKLSAQRFIQHYSVDRVMELAPLLSKAANAHRDPFSMDRRFEMRHPDVASALPDFIQGYDRSCESALAILEFLEKHFDPSPALAQIIRELARQKIC